MDTLDDYHVITDMADVKDIHEMYDILLKVQGERDVYIHHVLLRGETALPWFPTYVYDDDEESGTYMEFLYKQHFYTRSPEVDWTRVILFQWDKVPVEVYEDCLIQWANDEWEEKLWKNG